MSGLQNLPKSTIAYLFFRSYNQLSEPTADKQHKPHPVARLQRLQSILAVVSRLPQFFSRRVVSDPLEGRAPALRHDLTYDERRTAPDFVCQSIRGLRLICDLLPVMPVRFVG